VHAPVCPAGGRGAGFQVADLFRRHGAACAEAHPLSARQRKVLSAILRCRTAALGGHVDTCTHCGHERVSYNSCRDRHCPTCQFADQERWIRERQSRVLGTHYFHVVFTLPAPLRPLAHAHPKVVYDALFAAASETLLALGRDRFGATIGITAVLHTWTREMLLHPHLHCVVTGGGLARDGRRWVAARPNFLFPVAVMRKLFRGKLLAALDRAHKAGKLVAEDWGTIKRTLHRKTWVVFAKRPFGGPEQVFQYLGRYTHRVAISSSRLRDVTEDAVTFRTRGDATVSVTPVEFIRRFLLHVLPHGFRKIRHYGLVSPAGVAKLLPKAAHLLGAVPPLPPPATDYFTAADEVCSLCMIGRLERTLIPVQHPKPILPKWRDTS
jgi:hypothetical protein